MKTSKVFYCGYNIFFVCTINMSEQAIIWIANEKPIFMSKSIRYLLLVSGLFILSGFAPLNLPEAQEYDFKTLSFIHSAGFTVSKNIAVVAGEFANKYEEWRLSNIGISKQLFDYAVKGYEYLASKKSLQNTGIITIADLSKASTEKRLYVININSGEVLFHTLVAHGKNSGQQYATNFSNEESSFESSLGFYITTNTYDGKHGYSLRLNGCETGFNDKACKRAIVVHGAEYVSDNFIQQNGYLGRSRGCPAVPAELSKKIIDVIKNGSCLFVYSPLKKYLTQSAILNS